MKNIELKIEGMSCSHCTKAVETALRQLPEVREVQVELDSGRALVRADPEIAHGRMVAAVEEAGYAVVSASDA